MNQTGNRIVNQRIANLGKGETPPGSNRGPYVDACLRHVHIDPEHTTVEQRPWCAAALCKDIFDAGVKDGPRTGSTGGIFDWAAAHGQVIYVPRPVRKGKVKAQGKISDIQPGDAGLVIDDSSQTGFAHTCDIERIEGSNAHTIDSNVSSTTKRMVRPLNTLVVVRPYPKGMP